MNLRLICGLVSLAWVVFVGGCASQKQPDPRSRARELTPVYYLNEICNGITTSPDGRAFVCFPKPDGGGGARIAEMKSSINAVAYPNIEWNSWKVGDEASHKFVRANSLRFGPDGKLWIIDIGSPAMDAEVIKGGPKLVAIDIATNSVVQTIPLDDVVKPKSFVDDFRFNGPNVYITDAGEPALIVLDLASGKGRRVLENDKSTTGSRDMYASGKKLVKMDGTPLRMHADQLEVSPDGKTLLFMPPTGPMWHVETDQLEKFSPSDLSRCVGQFFDAPTAGGTCIDADGRLYIDDCKNNQVLRIKPVNMGIFGGGFYRGPRSPAIVPMHVEVVIRDERLQWGDAMWIDDKGDLWIPAAQINRSAGVNGGILKVQTPVTIYKLPIKAKNVIN